MKTIFILNEDGSVKGSITIPDDHAPMDYIGLELWTDVTPPTDLINPRFNKPTNSWLETETEDEKKNRLRDEAVSKFMNKNNTDLLKLFVEFTKNGMSKIITDLQKVYEE